MKALVMSEPGHVKMTEIPTPVPKEDVYKRQDLAWVCLVQPLQLSLHRGFPQCFRF